MSYLRCCPVFLALALALAADPSAVRADDLTPLLPAETEQFFYLDFHQIPRSKLFKMYLEEPIRKAIKDDLGKFEKELLNPFQKVTGINLLTDIEKILVTWTQSKGEPAPFTFVAGKSDLKKLVKEVGNPHPLIVITGKFDPEKLTSAVVEFAAANKEPYRTDKDGGSGSFQMSTVREKNHTLLKLSMILIGPPQGEGKTEPAFRLEVDFYGTVIDRQRVVFGFKSDVLAALDRAKRNAGSVIRNKDVADTLGRMDPATVCSFRIDNSILKELPAVDDPNIAKLLEKVTAVWGDLRVDKDIGVGAMLEMSDADAAKELKPMITKPAELLKTFLDFAITQEPKAAPLGEVGKNLTISSKGKKLTIRTSLSGEAIDSLVKLLK